MSKLDSELLDDLTKRFTHAYEHIRNLFIDIEILKDRLEIVKTKIEKFEQKLEQQNEQVG